MVGSFNKQLHTGFLFLGGVDLSDHENTFKGLATYLREHKCHVARLLPCDFPVRCHIGVPLSSLLRQFVQVNVETTDMEILAAWYAEPSNSGHPVVITIENVERCNSAILAELIVLLSEWSAEIPIVLVMGVATTADFLQGCLPSHALARLNARRFDLKTPLERLEAVVKAVLVESFSAFEIGHGVAQFITHFFLRHDLTISSFIRSLKVVCMEHFCNEPLSFLSEQLLKCRSQVELENQCATLPTELLQLAEGLPSVKRHFSRSGAEEEDGNVCISKHVAARLWALREQKQLWSMALLCVYEVGRHAGLRFLDLFCEALHTTLSSSSEIEKVPAESFLSSNLPQRMTSCGSSRGWQELKLKIREMSVPILRSLLEEWKKITSNATKLHSEISAVYNKIMGEEKLEHPTQSHMATSRVGATQALPTVVLQTPDQPENGSHLGQQVTNGSLTKEFPASSSPGNKRYKKSGQVSHDLRNVGGSSPASNLRRRPLHEESPQFPAIDLPKSPERRAPPVVCSVQEITVGCTSIVLPSSPERTFQVPGLQGSPRCPAAVSRSMKSLKKASSPPSKSPRKSPRRQTTTLLKSTDKISSSSPSDLQKPNTRQTTTPLKSSLPEKAFPDLGLQGSPRRMSTRLLSKSPEKASAVPGMQFSPTQHIKSKSPKSLEKVPLVLTLQKSPRKTSGKLIQSPWKLKSPIATCSPSQQRSSAAPDKVPAATQQAPHQAMGRSDLRKMASQNSLGNTRPGIMMMAPNQMVLDLLDHIVGQYLVPCQALPLHEIICFKDVTLLKQAITADTRQKVELDMLGSQLNLQCECCSPDGGLSGSMHDTCLVYHLSQEHGELINVHDWYQSFTAICCPPKASSDKQMSKRKDRRKGKRGRVEAESPTVLVDSTTLQARFTRATMELQLVGLLRMPKKGCPDFAQRVVLG